MEPAMRADVRLLIGCATLALVAAPGSVRRAHAQAFNATPTVVAGTANIDRSVPTFDTITVSSPSAIINWEFNASPPFPDPIIFLPSGNTAIFRNDAAGGTFAVLNRVIPPGTSRIRMDGRVISRVVSATGGLVPGGTVIFASPTGIIIGGKATFDVGNLLLTTLDPVIGAGGEFFTGGRLQLGGGGAFPDAAIVTEPGASFLATAEGSWIAFAAPRIDHGGNVRVNGSAAYVGAEAVDLVIDQGLFDITVTVGSQAANPIVHSGTTGGPASLGAADPHAIYMVAAGQQPITMLLSGNVGFDPAVDAAIENGAIVLSAGHDVSGGRIEREPANVGPAAIRITGGRFTSDVTGQARTEIVAGNTGPGTLTFEQDLRISAFQAATLSADAGFVTRVEGNALVSAANTDPVLFDSVENVVGGNAAIVAGGGGRVEILGSATVDASATGGVNGAGQVGSGRGGDARVVSDKAIVDIGGSLAVLSAGIGGDGLGAGLPIGGDGTGGNAIVSALNGGTLRVGGDTRLDAIGRGGSGTGAGGGTGATGTGGTARIEALSAGAVTLQGSTFVGAAGVGGGLAGGTGTTGGAGQGGTTELFADGGTIDLTGPTTLESDGSGGSAGAGGAGRGGGANVTARNGSIAFAGALQASASGTGASGAAGAGGSGGNGNAGKVNLIARSGGTPGIVTAPGAALRADGTGGSGGSGAGAIPGGRGGDGSGGPVVAVAEAATGDLRIGTLSASSRGSGGAGGASGTGAGGAGGNGSAGSVDAGTVPDAAGAPVAVGSGRAVFAATNLATAGVGGSGGGGATIGTGGTGTGGPVTLASNGAPVTVTGTAALQADASGGLGPAGARALAVGGAIILSAAPLRGLGGGLTIRTLAGSSVTTGDAGGASLVGRWQVSALGGSNVRIDDATLAATVTGTPAAGATSELHAQDGSTIRIVNAGTFATHGDIAVNVQGSGQVAGGALTLNGRTGIALTHTTPPAGQLTVDATRFTAITGGAYLANPGAIVSGRDGVAIQAGGDATLADTRTAATLDVTAGATARIRGTALGAQINVTSRDIDIPAGGQIGNAGTTLASLAVIANPAGTTLGGAAAGPGYTLTQAEAARVRADLVRVTAQGTGASTGIVVRDLALAGITAFEIATPGTVRVDGNLALAAGGAASRIGIAAGRLEVVTPTGSIRVRDAAGAPAGTLNVAAADIWIAEDAILAQLRADPNFAGRDALLRTNNGADTPRGYAEADAIRLAPRATLFVQNSGTPQAFAGLTVGAGGLGIMPSGAVPARVYAFGRRLNPDGSSVTNFDFYREVDFNRGVAPGYANDAEFNRCLINAGFCPGVVTAIPGNSFPAVFGPFLIPPQAPPGEPIDTSAFLAEPLIEEPVTSGSDSTLWVGPDDEDDDE
jgi:filamentous hemagglutinin family protein